MRVLRQPAIHTAVGGLLASHHEWAWNVPRHVPARREDTLAIPPMPYPVQFSVDYPDRSLNRLTSAFRIFVAIPILIVLGSVSGAQASFVTKNAKFVVIGAGGLLFLGPFLMILFRRKYPRWWFDWNVELPPFTNRVVASLFVLDDRYSATDPAL